MFETVLAFGAIILMGLVAVLVKLPLRWSLWLLGRPVATDLAVTGLTLWIHWGTMTGLMSATMAGLMCACVTSAGRAMFGYISGGRYIPGSINLTNRLMQQEQERKCIT